MCIFGVKIHCVQLQFLKYKIAKNNFAGPSSRAAYSDGLQPLTC